MIECVEGNIYYKKRRGRKKTKRLFLILLLCLFLVASYLYFDKIVFNNLINICYDSAFSYSTRAVNECVYEETDEFSYSNIVKVEKNSVGDIVLISTNPVKVNALNRKIALKTEKKLSEYLKSGIEIPLLAFTGVKFLSGLGRNVKYKSLTVSSVVCNFKEDFASAGINQTIHSLYLEVVCKYAIEFPLDRKEGECATCVLISESVIVGKIPEIYLSR